MTDYKVHETDRQSSELQMQFILFLDLLLTAVVRWISVCSFFSPSP